MTKPHRIITSCESCGAELDLTSPPPQEYYQKGVIYLENKSLVLLNNEPTALSHAACLDGVYCDVNCLTSHLQKLRGTNETKEPQA